MTEKTEFLPFHAINEFMRPDFRLTVIRETLTAADRLPESLLHNLNHQIKKNVTVPGFRSSDKAPALIKVLPTSKAFEKQPEVVPAILAGWSEINSELRQQVYSVLKSRNWKMLADTEAFNLDLIDLDLLKEWPVLPLNVDRSKLPGFFLHWPKNEDFEAIYKTFSELYLDSQASIDKVSLMVVWLTMRLPFQVESDNEVPAE